VVALRYKPLLVGREFLTYNVIYGIVRLALPAPYEQTVDNAQKLRLSKQNISNKYRDRGIYQCPVMA